MKRWQWILVCLMVSGMCLPTWAAVLTIDAHPDHQVEINPHIYGVNIANWCQHYYLKLCEPMLTNAGVTIVRYGATNIERYNWRNNRMYNVISKTNQFVPMSWEAFINWVQDDLDADVFMQASVFSHVASDYGSANYNTNQTLQDIRDWVTAAGTNVAVWGVGNEPFIAWKLEGYAGARGDESYAYNDGAHGDQIFNEDIAEGVFYPQFTRVADAIRGTNPDAIILGPTPCNWWLYWSTDYSPFCPATRANPGDHTNANGWFTMAASANQWDPHVFPDRAGNPNIIGWEQNEDTGTFNDKRIMCQFAKQMGEYAATHGGTQVCNYLDFHRYMNCDQDSVAVQEVRDLWDPDYQSYDKETGGSGTRTKILRRFQDILDNYNTNMSLSLSEYDYFYWQGHPAVPQIAALGQVDYLGTFSRLGVQLACNWYIGEPDQSGGGYHHAADSAKQAMFNEMGEPNPKYWAFKLMSDHFRDRAVWAGSSDNQAFSVYGGLDTVSSQMYVVAHYKGEYHPWYDEHSPGGFVEGAPSTNATIVISNFTVTGVSRVLRYGLDDPGIIHMDTGGVSVAGNCFSYEFEPLSIYLFELYGSPAPPAETVPTAFALVWPDAVKFGPYETGIELVEEEDHETHEVTVTTNYTSLLKISNNRNSNTVWSISESCDWLAVVGSLSGTVRVSDVVYLMITNKAAYDVGVYTACLTVTTSEGQVDVPVSMEVIPGTAGGERRIFDAETHSLAHAWGNEEPYSIGFYDGHGNTEDKNDPYIYTFSMDYDEVSDLGDLASMRVDFDRSAGDNAAGRLYTAFGTYGHYDATQIWVPTNGNPSNYVFKFDIKTKTEGAGFTKTRLLMVFTDEDGNQGKPNVLIDDFKDSPEIDDGAWQTIAIPLGGEFYDWRYPEGQDGSLVDMNFAAIRQIEFCPWVGREDKAGVLWLDNLRIETVDANSNHYPVAVAEQDERLIGTNETATFTATNSYDIDGSIASYQWSPSSGLSATNVASPVFSPPGPGVYTFELTVVDNEGLKNRNPAQVVIKVMPTLEGSSMTLYRDAAMTDVVGSDGTNCLVAYIRLVCSAGGNTDEVDFTMARITTTDSYGADSHNNVDPIDVVLEETGEDTKVFTGQIRLSAFSDELEGAIGVSQGSVVTVSNAGVQASTTVGRQYYGYQRYVDYVERGTEALNLFEGPWYSYNDHYNNNTSLIYMAATNVGAHTGSSQSMHGWGELRLGPTGSVDQLFAGFGTKLTAYTNEDSVAVCDLSSSTGVQGIRFWLKGNGNKLAVVLRSMAITNYDDYLVVIPNTPSNDWKEYHLLFTDFEQEGWGNAAVERETALREVNSIQFKFASKLDHQTNHVYIDDLALFGGDVHYASNAVYHRQNAVSMEGYAGMELVNPSLTNAGSSTTTIDGWALSGNVRGEDWGANGGDAVFEQWNGSSGVINQDVAGVSPGDQYQLTVQMSKHADFAGEIYLDMVWLNSSDGVLSTNSTTNIAATITTADWPLSTHLTGYQTAPANAAKVRVQVRAVSVTAENAKLHDASLAGSSKQADDGWNEWSGLSVSYTTNCAEGQYAAQFDTTNTDWVAGMYVPPYGQDVTLTNFSAYSGIALKARRSAGYTGTGAEAARIRLSAVTGTVEVAKTRWINVDGSLWEDSLVFPLDRFYTLDTCDTNDPAGLEVWSNSWEAIDRIYIYYGPATSGVLPYDILLDDFRPCWGTYLH